MCFVYSVVCLRRRLSHYCLLFPFSQQQVRFEHIWHLPTELTLPCYFHQVTMAILLNVTPKEWLGLGLESVGFGPFVYQDCLHAKNVERFVAHFGASPETHCAIFSDLQLTKIDAARITKPSIVHFLIAMFWLKTYSSEPVMAARFKVDEKTARTQVWKYILAIQGLKGQKASTTGVFPFKTVYNDSHLSCSLLVTFLLDRLARFQGKRRNIHNNSRRR